MFCRLNPRFVARQFGRSQWNLTRFLSQAEGKAALKPFYFAVHPDLFGQFPTQRAINEDSLKKLNSYIHNLENRYPVNPTHLTFYLKNGVEHEEIQCYQETNFKTVQISLFSRDLCYTVNQILKCCGMTEDVQSSHDASSSYHGGTLQWLHIYHPENTDIPQSHEKPKVTLKSFVHDQAKDVKEKLKASEKSFKEATLLSQQIIAEMGLKSLVLDSGWTRASCQGALKNLLHLCKADKPEVKNLKGRHVMLTTWSGVDPLGDVMLNMQDVPQFWLALFGALEDFDVLVHQVPLWENRLSNPLGNINIVYEQSSPSLGITEYLNYLHRLVMSLRRYRFGRIGYPLKPGTFKGVDCRISSPNGPMTLSHDGQFRIPASTPADVLIDFLVKNKEKSFALQEEYKRDLLKENEQIRQCVESLGLKSLTKNESVSSSQMSSCLESLTRQPLDELRGTRIVISRYYQVSGDGQITLPWDWE